MRGLAWRKPKSIVSKNTGGRRSKLQRRRAIIIFRNTSPNLGDPAGYHPRDQLPPTNVADVVDRNISRATETDDVLRRYLVLLRFARSTMLLVVSIVLGCILIFWAGVALAVVLAGLHIWLACGVGAGGTFACIFTAVRNIRRYLKRAKRALYDRPEDPDRRN
jgi:hypothetical protein